MKNLGCGLVQVPSIQTSDGQKHDSKLAALLHQRNLDLRGLIQSGPRGIPLKGGNLTVTEAVQIISEQAENITKIMGKFRRAINHERTKARPSKSI